MPHQIDHLRASWTANVNRTLQALICKRQRLATRRPIGVQRTENPVDVAKTDVLTALPTGAHYRVVPGTPMLGVFRKSCFISRPAHRGPTELPEHPDCTSGQPSERPRQPMSEPWERRILPRSTAPARLERICPGCLDLARLFRESAASYIPVHVRSSSAYRGVRWPGSRHLEHQLSEVGPSRNRRTSLRYRTTPKPHYRSQAESSAQG